MSEHETTHDVPTRAQWTRSIVALLMVWTFLFAVVAQNAHRLTPMPSAPQPPAFAPHELLLYVTEEGDVYTFANGIGTPHVRLHDCRNPRYKMMFSPDGLDFVSSDTLSWLPTARYVVRIQADQPYSVASSYIAAEVRFSDGRYIRLLQECQTARDEAQMFVFVTNGMVFLGDTANGTATPLFELRPTCALVWNTGAGESRAYTWDMPAAIGIEGVAGDTARFAFAFEMKGHMVFEAYSQPWTYMVHQGGFVSLYPDCVMPEDEAPAPPMDGAFTYSSDCYLGLGNE